MKNSFFKNVKNVKNFGLAEILMVVAVIGILVAIFIPFFQHPADSYNAEFIAKHYVLDNRPESIFVRDSCTSAPATDGYFNCTVHITNERGNAELIKLQCNPNEGRGVCREIPVKIVKP